MPDVSRLTANPLSACRTSSSENSVEPAGCFRGIAQVESGRNGSFGLCSRNFFSYVKTYFGLSFSNSRQILRRRSSPCDSAQGKMPPLAAGNPSPRTRRDRLRSILMIPSAGVRRASVRMEQKMAGKRLVRDGRAARGTRCPRESGALSAAGGEGSALSGRQERFEVGSGAPSSDRSPVVFKPAPVFDPAARSDQRR